MLYHKIQQDRIVEYCKTGCFLVCSSDTAFTNLLKSVIFSMTGNSNLITVVQEFTTILETEKILLTKYDSIIIFIEKYFYGEITLEKIKYLKEVCQLNCKLICICNESDQFTVTQIYEMGADNIIIKPISIGSLIDKIDGLLQSDTTIKEFIIDCEKYITEKDYDNAQYCIDKIFEKKPNSCIGYMLLGDMCKSKSEFEKAEVNYTLAIDKASLFLDPLKRMVSLYDSLNNLEKKLEYLIKLDLLSPLNYKRKIEIGSTYVELDQIERAEYYFSETIRHIKNSAIEQVSAVLMDISNQVKNKNPELALKYIKEAIFIKKDIMSENDLWMFNEMGILLRQKKRWEDAITCYKAALKINPQKASLYYNIGMAFFEGKKYIDSVRNFELAIQYRPSLISDSSTIPFNIACVYNLLNDKSTAVFYLQKCLDIDPTHEHAILLLNRIRGIKT